jgi:hypothetical protein
MEYLKGQSNSKSIQVTGNVTVDLEFVATLKSFGQKLKALNAATLRSSKFNHSGND